MSVFWGLIRKMGLPQTEDFAMNINLHFENHALILFLEGHFNRLACLEAQKLLHHAKVNFYPHVIFDLAQVSSVDKCGLELMLMVARTLKNSGGRLSIVTPQSQIRLMVEQKDMGHLVSVYTSQKEALTAA